MTATRLLSEHVTAPLTAVYSKRSHLPTCSFGQFGRLFIIVTL